MPYKTNADLPDAIKNSLPDDAQSTFRSAVNAALESTDDEEQAAKIAWSAVKKAGWKKTEDGKWEKESAHSLQGVEIFSEGTWNGDEYSGKDLQDIVKNFSELRETIKPPLKIGHNSPLNKRSDGNPAIGWISNVYVRGKKLVADIVDIPNIVYEAIKKKLYKRVSAEMLWGYSSGDKQYSKVLAGVSLLGASLPAVTNLQDLQSFFQFDGELKTYEINCNKGEIETIKGGDCMPENIKEYEDKIAKQEAELKTYREKVASLEAEKIQQKKNGAISCFRIYCENAVKDGRLAPVTRDVLLKDFEKHTYSADDGFSIPLTVVQEAIKSMPVVLDTKEYGKAQGDKKYTDVAAEVDRRTKEYAQKNNIDYASAMTFILQDDEKLFNAYRSLEQSSEE